MKKKKITKTRTDETGRFQVNVCGERTFPQQHWRDGIRYYLDKVWSNNIQPADDLRLTLDGVTLELIPDKDEYIIYGWPGRDLHHREPPVGGLEENSRCSQMEVEGKLIRFVNNDDVSALVINLPRVRCKPNWWFYGSCLEIHKTVNRGEFRVACNNIAQTREEFFKRQLRMGHKPKINQ